MRSRRGGARRWRCGSALSALRIIGFTALATCSLTTGSAGAETADTPGSTRRVVVLNATDPYLPAFVALDRALREAIRAGSAAPVEFFAETLDMHRFPRRLLDDEVVALLRNKYQDLSVDVVVSMGAIAFDFAERQRDDIWPGADIVFNTVSGAMLAERALPADVIGVPQQLEIAETLDLALRLRPQTRRIVVVASDGDCCASVALARQVLERYVDSFTVQYLVDLSVADTLAAVAALPEDAVVLYLLIFRDGRVSRRCRAMCWSASPPCRRCRSSGSMRPTWATASLPVPSQASRHRAAQRGSWWSAC